MKITLFTSNNNRHNYLINLFSNICDELFVVQECGTIFPGIIRGHYPESDTMKKYFENVDAAQNKLFGNSYVNNFNKNIKILPILSGDLNKCSLTFLSDFLNSDIYVVFGSSYIKRELVDYLVEKKTINIHAGVSPYYRGTDCNFSTFGKNRQSKLLEFEYLLIRKQGKIIGIFHLKFLNLQENNFLFLAVIKLSKGNNKIE